MPRIAVEALHHVIADHRRRRRPSCLPPGVTRINVGPDAPKQAQTAPIKARPGETIEFGAGRFDFTSTLSLDVSGVTV